MIFVFGSNEAGRHGKGAARTAVISYGAVMGQAQGLQGSSYAIPTKDRNLVTLSTSKINFYVQNFFDYATFDRPDLVFQVTRIGCGLAGYPDEAIAPLFKGAPRNCCFDEKWRPILGTEGYRYWGTF